MGKGTTGSDFDLTLVNPEWGRDIHLKTNNIALFAENKWQLSRQMEVTTGIRIESGETNMSGKITYYPSHAVPVQMKHRVLWQIPVCRFLMTGLHLFVKD